jgi:hypothetical protein
MKRLYTPTLLTVLFLLFLSTSCNKRHFADGTYCADVKRYNPTTGRSSQYKLTLELVGQRLVQMNFPNGGHTDSGEFDPPRIVNGSATFNDYRGVQFSVDIVGTGTDCLQSAAKATRCTGTTKSGTRCKNMTDNGSSRCFQH